MPTASRLRPFDAARDEPAVRRTLALAFGGTPDGVGGYLDLVGRDAMRVLDDGASAPTTCLARIPMAQYFGGKSVPMVGIAAVGVAPEARGGGRARALMQASIHEIASERVALSCLYASTQALYRQVGFEQAGTKFEFRVPLRQLTQGTRDLPIESLELPDDRVKACYAGFARRFDGMLDRGPFVWSRVKQFRDVIYNGFAVVPDGPGGAIEGYVYLTQKRHDTGRHDIALSDLAFTTRRAALRLLGLIRDFTSMGLTLTFAGGPCHPIVTMLDQQWIEAHLREYWMLRITDPERAIAQRGYAPNVNVDVLIEVDDDLVPATCGRWRLRVADGRGALERATGSGSAVCITPRGFAAIYSGFLSPSQAALQGLVDGADDALARLASAFAGTAPWMTDHF